MKQRQKEEKDITTSALNRLLIASFMSSTCYALFFFFFPTNYIIDTIIPSFSSLVFLTLSIYFRYCANTHEKIERTIKFYIYFSFLNFVPATLFFVTMAWQGQLNFINEFPPVTSLILVIISLGLIMLPRQYTYYIVIMWAFIALPILLFLITHPEQLHTPRGYELLATFGPVSLLLYTVFPYQNSVRRHLNKVAFNLKRSQLEAGRDFLTDVYNRRGLEHWVEGLKKDDQINVLLIDIDHFKAINDNYGHTIGDRALVETASRLRSIYFKAHTIGRWGGEEFMVVLVNPNPNALESIGEMFQIALSSTPYKTIGKMTVSIGQSKIDNKGQFQQLIEQADKALYHAKNKGRNQLQSYQEDDLDSLNTNI